MPDTESRRLELHEILCEILGSRHVYFQPTTNTRMVYPAIRYARENYAERYANNSKYIRRPKYVVTVISDDPTNTIGDSIAKLQNCSTGSRYVSDNLYHDTFYIYY